MTELPAGRANPMPTVRLAALLLLGLASTGVLPCSARGFSLSPAQENAAIGRRMVPEAKLQCLTMVSPTHPQGSAVDQKAATVVLRVIVTKTGNVLPQHKISGPTALEMEATNAVRLWRYRPYVDAQGDPTDVTTDLRVEFAPDKPGGLISHPNH